MDTMIGIIVNVVLVFPSMSVTLETPESFCKQFAQREKWTANKERFLEQLLSSTNNEFQNSNQTKLHYLMTTAIIQKFCKQEAGRNSVLKSPDSWTAMSSELQRTRKCTGSDSTFSTFLEDFMDYFHIESATLIDNEG